MIIDYEYLAFDALSLMNSKKISQLIATKAGEYVGMVHIHQILKSGFRMTKVDPNEMFFFRPS